MATEVIMPALGMAQETGKLLTWLKAPRDPVNPGDVLFEVETDKSVSEVEAQVGGFLTDVTARPGEDIPVGQRIAMISDSVDDSAPVTLADPDPFVAQPEPAPEPVLAERNPRGPAAGAAATTGRVLASPKARRLAAEQGLDLTRLQEAGYPQPYHVADLIVLRNLPEEAAPSARPRLACHHITAQVPTDALAAFRLRMASEGGVDLPEGAVLCNFVAAAWRKGHTQNNVVLGLRAVGQPDRTLIDPDLHRLSAQPEDQTETLPALILCDLTSSFITAMQVGVSDVPLINIASDGATYTLSLSYLPDQMADDRAIEFVTDVAARIADPLPYLV